MSKPWSTQEEKTLFEMLAAGERASDIARQIGRSLKGVEGKIEYLNLSPLQREERRQALRRRRAKEQAANTTRVHPNGQVVAASRPSNEVLAERNQRAALMPRDLTAAFFGDPLPGYSALERRA